VSTNETQTFLLSVGVHSPGEVRYVKLSIALQVASNLMLNCRPVGALTNNREFAAAFNCPEGSRMNPAEKCELW
jgi:predicted metalloendopeptidase